MVKKTFIILCVSLCTFLCANPGHAECEKDADCRGIIETALKDYFKTDLVSGEQGAPVDWCYYERWREVFIFLSTAVNSPEALKTEMRRIGEKILAMVEARQRNGKRPGKFEKSVLHKGLVVRAMVKGMVLPNGSLAIHVVSKRDHG